MLPWKQTLLFIAERLRLLGLFYRNYRFIGVEQPEKYHPEGMFYAILLFRLLASLFWC